MRRLILFVAGGVSVLGYLAVGAGVHAWTFCGDFNAFLMTLIVGTLAQFLSCGIALLADLFA